MALKFTWFIIPLIIAYSETTDFIISVNKFHFCNAEKIIQFYHGFIVLVILNSFYTYLSIDRITVY